jgi:hypothetical protein
MSGVRPSEFGTEIALPLENRKPVPWRVPWVSVISELSVTVPLVGDDSGQVDVSLPHPIKDNTTSGTSSTRFTVHPLPRSA